MKPLPIRFVVAAFLSLPTLPAATLPIWAADKVQATLPLREVALFSSGVGYFGRGGRVSGDTEIDLQLRAPQLSDILKSLVLFDPGGNIRPVSYALNDWAKNPAHEKDLSLNAQSTLGDLLATFQGAEVHFEREGGSLQGQILSVSRKTMKVKEGNSKPEIVTLLTESGMREISLETVTATRLVDAKLNTKLRDQLKKRATGLTTPINDELRSVSLRFGGGGTRDVRAGYLLETATWKTTYRLVLDAKAKPYLQGWAIVENTTDEDWKNVRLSLISGRPVSFIQNLQAPLYVGRPVIDVGIPNTSPRPQTFGESFDVDKVALNIPQQMGNRAPAAPALRAPDLRSRGRGIFSNSGADESEAMEARADIALAAQKAPLDAQAQGSEKGELFEYAIEEPVTLERNRAAMVPIVSQDTEGEAVTIIESHNAIGRLVPANGFKLHNSSGLHLQGGAITVYSDGVYAGDALITNVAPDDKRLLTYALDLNVLARLDKIEQDSSITAISSSGGALRVNRKAYKTYVYALRNKDKKAKTIILQMPDETEWTLVDAAQLHEKSAEGLRFRVTLKPGESRVYHIRQQKPLIETVTVADLDLKQIEFYAAQKVLSPASKTAFQNLAARKQKVQSLTLQLAQKEKELAAIADDQTRIRANMNTLGRDSALYKQYEAKLTVQEPKIDALRSEIVQLRDAEATAQTDLRAYLDGLNFE